MASSETLLAASSALNSLLARRQKQKQKTQAAGTIIKRTSSPKNKNKKPKTSTAKILSEEEEIRRLGEAEEKNVEANVKILKELDKTGKKEKVVMSEVHRSPNDCLPLGVTVTPGKDRTDRNMCLDRSTAEGEGVSTERQGEET